MDLYKLTFFNTFEVDILEIQSFLLQQRGKALVFNQSTQRETSGQDTMCLHAGVRGQLEARGGGSVIIWTVRNEEEAGAVTRRR